MSKLDKLRRQSHKPPVGDIEAILGVIPITEGEVRQLDIDLIDIAPQFNPRYAYLPMIEQERLMSPESLAPLVESFLTPLADGEIRGVLQPLTLRPSGERFSLVAGERRLRAARLAGLQQVPVVIRELTDVEALEVAVIENEQRQDVDPVAQAMSGFQLMTTKTGLTEEALIKYLNAVRQGAQEDSFGLESYLRQTFGTGISTWSQQRAKVLSLTPAERLAVQHGKLPAKSAFALIPLGESPHRAEILQRALALPEPPTAQQMIALIGEPAARPALRLSRQLRQLAQSLDRLEGQKAQRAAQLLKELEALFQ